PKTGAYLQQGLTEAGFNVDRVMTGTDALQHALSEPYDLLILDVMMPGLDGFQVLHELRSEPRWAELPVIVWTALTLTAEEVETLARSAVAIASAGEAGPLRQVRDALLEAARRGRRGRRALQGGT
ncbi:MAG: response regulator, partial [Roseateles sp.]